MKTRWMVLTFLVDQEKDRILLARKKRGFGEGKWNGFGGKIDPGETAEEAAIREAKEEAGIEIDKANMVHAGELTFRFKDRPDWNITCSIFFVHRFIGTPRETEEMGEPTWYPYGEIPYAGMWPDDIYWLPDALTGKRVEGEFFFDHEGEEVISYSIKGMEMLGDGEEIKNKREPHVIESTGKYAEEEPKEKEEEKSSEKGEEKEDIPNLRKI